MRPRKRWLVIKILLLCLSFPYLAFCQDSLQKKKLFDKNKEKSAQSEEELSVDAVLYLSSQLKIDEKELSVLNIQDYGKNERGSSQRLITAKATDGKLYQFMYTEPQEGGSPQDKRFSDPRIIALKESKSDPELERDAVNFLAKKIARKNDDIRIVQIVSITPIEKEEKRVSELVLKTMDGRLYQLSAFKINPESKWEFKMGNLNPEIPMKEISFFAEIPQWMRDLGVTPENLFEYYLSHLKIALDKGAAFFDQKTGRYKLPEDWWSTIKVEPPLWMKYLGITFQQAYNYYRLHPEKDWNVDSAFFNENTEKYTIPADWAWMNELGVTADEVEAYYKAHPNTAFDKNSPFYDEKTGKHKLPGDWAETLRMANPVAESLASSSSVTFDPHLRMSQEGDAIASYWAVDYPSGYMNPGYRQYLYNKAHEND